MTAEEIQEKMKWGKDKEIQKIITHKNYGVVFIKQNDFDEDNSTLYDTIASIIYNQAKKLA